MKKSSNGVRLEDEWEVLGYLPPERKVEIMTDMTSASVCICMDGIRNQNPRISDEELLAKLRERVQWRKRAARGRRENGSV